MANVNSIINKCMQMSASELKNFAGENYKTVYKEFTKHQLGEEANTFLIGCIFAMIAVDGCLTQPEYRFIAEFIGGYSYEQAYECASNMSDASIYNTMKNVFEVFSYEVKEAFVCLCIAVLCVDKDMDGYENDFLNYLLY